MRGLGPVQRYCAHEQCLDGSLGKLWLDSTRSMSPGDPAKKASGPPEWAGGNYCLFTIYPGQNTTLVLVEMPPNDDSSPLSPLRAGCGLRGERPPHGTMQGHLSVQPPWSPGEVKRPRNGTMLRKQLGNVCWMERPVGTARTVGTHSQEDEPPTPPRTCT